MATTPIQLSIENLHAHLAVLRAELQEGHVVELLSGNQVIGEVHARPNREAHKDVIPKSARPDFMAQLRELWGDQPLKVDTTAWVREDRDGNVDVP